jgi:hypothetical protein
MANPLEQSIRSGVRANARIGDLFAKLGAGEHPRGVVPTIYRSGMEGLTKALAAPNRQEAARAALVTMRRELDSELRSLLLTADELGKDEAARQLSFFKIEAAKTINLSTQSQGALQAILTRFDAQTAAVSALLATGASEDLILGGESRTGVLRPGDVLSTSAFWLARSVWTAWAEMVQKNSNGFSKQAVAALDNRTTDCCLRVHGQVQPLNGQFNLTGDPRYADNLDWAPFHWWCRTSIVLYKEEFDDGLTERMRTGARTILNERADGKRVDRYPVSAFG